MAYIHEFGDRFVIYAGHTELDRAYLTVLLEFLGPVHWSINGAITFPTHYRAEWLKCRFNRKPGQSTYYDVLSCIQLAMNYPHKRKAD